jgi:hypothetical protein
LPLWIINPHAIEENTGVARKIRKIHRKTMLLGFIVRRAVNKTQVAVTLAATRQGVSTIVNGVAFFFNPGSRLPREFTRDEKRPGSTDPGP